MSKTDNTILVTGSSSGIGRAIARRLADDGFQVVVHYGRNRDAGEATAEHITEAGGVARLVSFDIANADECRAVLENDMDSHGAYYGVVCNAGSNHDAAFPMLSEDNWKSIIDTNLNGFYNVLHPLVMPMIRRRAPGRIVTMSSVSGLLGNRGQTNYSAAKAGIIGATKALAVELAKRKITVNCVAPGLIDTEMTNHEHLDEMIGHIPLQRMGTPEEVAAVVSFLCAPDASYITRQVISINGGLC
ncbi:MAG TPA: 3-oxoacyl-ACP reductase FabG [Xanthomonadales bacterium]|nr:3-oxoacyl-ACP reductase FabG [Xanthomonadales bacterium]